MQMAVFIFEHKSEMPVIKEIPQLVTHPRSQAVQLSTIAFIHVHTENTLLATLQVWTVVSLTYPQCW